ncbi:hypothetical protein OsI_31997 [Oryza sativa Indica Group]|uniref:Post-SET domain-containing protein n=1 Tax=Oryza sativa subsp. indica TaxID=39946 RepID=B8BDD1_ORYSI|nr:hypothetical protein OsI_31997 [Oryza sativa Indica Group]
MPDGINATAIVLISKVNRPMELKEFRPISLCNVIYKIVSKCLVNRLRPILDDLISQNQSAFVPGRMITDNALLAFECFHSIQRNKSPGKAACAYKLDLSKAYDRVDWSFLEQAMYKLGFTRRWGKRKTHWRAWKYLTKAKQYGGLGFKDFKLFNQALLARQAWRLIVNPDSLCARVLKAKYFPNGTLVDTCFSGNASPGWRAIEYGLELIKKGCIWRVGNGQSVCIWRDPWIPRDHSRRPITRKGNCRMKWVSELLGLDGVWDVQKDNRVFLPCGAEEILRIQTSMRQDEDFLAWHPDKMGRFSVRSAYKLAMSLANMDESSSSSDDKSRKMWDLIWKCEVPQKVKIFMWKAATNSLATMENKKRRKLEQSEICCICGTATCQSALSEILQDPPGCLNKLS